MASQQISLHPQIHVSTEVVLHKASDFVLLPCILSCWVSLGGRIFLNLFQSFRCELFQRYDASVNYINPSDVLIGIGVHVSIYREWVSVRVLYEYEYVSIYASKDVYKSVYNARPRIYFTLIRANNNPRSKSVKKSRGAFCGFLLFCTVHLMPGFVDPAHTTFQTCVAHCRRHRPPSAIGRSSLPYVPRISQPCIGYVRLGSSWLST